MEFQNLLTLIKTVSDSELTGFQYEENGVKIKLSKKQDHVQVITGEAQAPGKALSSVSMSPAQTEVWADTHAAAQEPEALSGNIVESPLVGTFYTAPAEGAEVFAAVGDSVKKGQTLAIVEAMKLMNEIESEYDGTVAEVYVANGQAVEYGQPLFRIS